jgi:hypothetical protein
MECATQRPAAAAHVQHERHARFLEQGPEREVVGMKRRALAGWRRGDEQGAASEPDRLARLGDGAARIAHGTAPTAINRRS